MLLSVFISNKPWYIIISILEIQHIRNTTKVTKNLYDGNSLQSIMY